MSTPADLLPPPVAMNVANLKNATGAQSMVGKSSKQIIPERFDDLMLEIENAIALAGRLRDKFQKIRAKALDLAIPKE